MSEGLSASLIELFRRPRFEGTDLIRTLKRNRALAECYSAPMGGVDGLTLEDHTLNALALYERYFEHRTVGLMSTATFKLLLALHDLGKPAAIAQRRPADQHAGTLRIIRDVLGGIDWLGEDQNKIEVLIDGDPIGACLNRKQHLPLAEATGLIERGARRLRVPVRDYWNCLVVYYQCDAAAYPSLSVKVFNSDGCGQPRLHPEAGRFVFCDPEEASRFAMLESRVLEGNATIDWG